MSRPRPVAASGSFLTRPRGHPWLIPGPRGTISAVRGEGALRNRLLDMGLIPHTQVQLQKTAPMGDPIEIKVRGYELTLRLEEAANIVLADETVREAGV